MTVNVDDLVAHLWKLQEIRAEYERRGYTHMSALDNTIIEVEHAIERMWKVSSGPPCPVCGGAYPWLWLRDPATRAIVGCTHDITFAVPALT